MTKGVKRNKEDVVKKKKNCNKIYQYVLYMSIPYTYVSEGWS